MDYYYKEPDHASIWKKVKDVITLDQNISLKIELNR